MAYSVKSLFVLRKPSVKRLYERIWTRVMLKAGCAAFIAAKTRSCVPEEALLAALLSEVGTLAILSALADGDEVLSNSTFFQLCREYSKPFGAVLLSKWEIDEQYISTLKYCGRWSYESGLSTLCLADVLSLALFSTIQKLNVNNNLPDINHLPAYQKLPSHLNSLTEETSMLTMVEENPKEIESLVGVLKG
ncbi:MAG: HD-like signal output (HDOD) protein [Flavobacteriales bacterium]|jgi:HD-like signal output (HDOD) protein